MVAGGASLSRLGGPEPRAAKDSGGHMLWEAGERLGRLAPSRSKGLSVAPQRRGRPRP